MKTRFLTLVLVLSTLVVPFVHAANDVVVSVLAEIKSSPDKTATLAVRAATDHRDQAGAIFKAVFATLTDDAVKSVMVDSIKLSPELAPVITQHAVARLAARASTPEEAAKIATAITQLSVTTAVATQSSPAAANRLAAAIAGSAVRALPAAADSVSRAAALAQPSAAPEIKKTVSGVLDFAPQPPQVIVSPSS